MKPGATTMPLRVDDDVAGLRLHVADGDDAIVDEADVGAPQRRAGAVGQVGADDRRRAIGGAARRASARETIAATVALHSTIACMTAFSKSRIS